MIFVRKIQHYIFTKIAQFILYKFPLAAVVVLGLSCGMAICSFYYDDKQADPLESFILRGSVLKDHLNVYRELFPRDFSAEVIFTFLVNDSIKNISTVAAIFEIEKEILDLEVEKNCSLKKSLYAHSTLTSLPNLVNFFSTKNITVNDIEMAIKKARTKNIPAVLQHSLPIDMRGWRSIYFLKDVSGLSTCLKSLTSKAKHVVNLHTSKKSYTVLITESNDFLTEYRKTVSSDTIFMILGYSFVIVFLCLSLGGFSLRNNRIILGLIGAICIALSYQMGVASGRIFSIKSSLLTKLSIVLLAGIGVDDIYVICSEYDIIKRRHPSEKLKKIYIRTIQRAGLAIFVTTATDVMGLLTGANSFIFAVRSLCLYTMTSVIYLFIITIVCFTSALHLYEIIIQKLCTRKDAQVAINDDTPISTRFNLLKESICGWLTSSLPIRIFIVAITITGFGLGLFGTVHLKAELSFIEMMSNLYLPDSFILNYIKCISYIYEYNPLFQFFVLFKDVDVCSESHRTALLNLTQTLKNNPDIDKNSVQSVFDVFTKIPFIDNQNALPTITCVLGIGKCPGLLKSQFGKAQFFLNSFPKSWRENPTCLVSGRIDFQLLIAKNLNVSLTRINPIIARLRNLNNDYNFTVFPFSHFDSILPTSEYTVMLQGDFFIKLAFLVIFCMIGLLLFVAHLKSAVLSGICVCFSIVDVMGLMFISGMPLEVTTSITLILCVGFSIDYVTHINIGYVSSSASLSSVKRSQSSLEEMAPPILRGGFSTILPFIPLIVFAKSQASLIFAKVFVINVLISLWHALLFLPVLLSFLDIFRTKKALEIENLAADKDSKQRDVQSTS